MIAVTLALVAGILAAFSSIILKAGGFSWFLPGSAFNFLSFVVFFYALSKGRAVVVAPLMGVTSTLSTVAAGSLIFGETLALQQYVGIFLLVGGSALLSATGKK